MCEVLDFTRADLFRLDMHPLTANSPICESRAYMHHLLNCNELLASILLTQYVKRLDFVEKSFPCS